MHITGLEASGLKGLSFAHALQRCVLITGPNWSGKSARLEAVRLALLGFVPALGKQNQATWGLASGGTLFSKVIFDDGTDANVSFKLEGDSVTMARRWAPDWLKDAKMPMLDPAEYFSLTDSERVQYVFTMMQMPDTMSVEGIVADLRNLTLDENTEQTEKARNEIIGAVATAFKEHSLSEALIGLTADRGVLKTLFTYSNKRAKDTQGTLRVLSELKTRSGECSADTIQRVAAELTRVSNALEIANRESGDLSRRQMDANRVGLRRQQIEKELETGTLEQDPAPLVKAIADCDKKLKKTESVTPESVSKLRDEMNAVKSAETTAASEYSKTENELYAAQHRLRELASMHQCPHCKSRGKGWKETLETEYRLTEEDWKAKLATATTQLAELRKKAVATQKAYDKTQNAQDARQALQNLRAGYQTTLDSLNARATGAAARRQALQEELASLKDVSAPTEAELLYAATRTMNLKVEHARLSQQHTSLVQLQQDLIRAGEAAEEHRIAAAKVAVIKAVGALLKERQATMIDVLFRDLMKVANYFVDGIMEYPLVFQDGRIGYVKQGRFVGHKTFSGTERALTYIAITAALMKDAPLRVVLLDEFDIDRDVFPKVLDRLNGSVSDGYIDQVIVAHTELPPGNWSGPWQHIPL